MIKSPTTLTRRSVFRAGAGLAVAGAATSFFTPNLAQAETQSGGESLNGHGFYRFKIGDFKATVISDGYGQIPIKPVFVMNATDAEMPPVLTPEFLQHLAPLTTHLLIANTTRA